MPPQEDRWGPKGRSPSVSLLVCPPVDILFISLSKICYIIKDMDPWIYGSAAGAAARAASAASAVSAVSAVCIYMKVSPRQNV